MASLESTSELLRQLQAGDPAAAQQLWDKYFPRMVRVARAKLQGTKRRAADEEDVALDAFDSFCRGAAAGRFPDVHDRHGLWPLLVTITVRKAIKLAKHERRKKRGGGDVRGDSVLTAPKDHNEETAGWDTFLGREPNPAFALQMAQECRRLLEQLTEEPLRAIALWKMEGFTNSEIAAKLGCMERTVERKLREIRRIWKKNSG